MLHCVHIFVGEEYVKLLETIGSFAKEKQDVVKYNNFYNFCAEKDGKASFHKMDVVQKNGVCDFIWNNKDLINKDELSGYWSDKVFDKILNVTNTTQDVLYVFVHMPLYKSKSLELVKELCLAINESKRPVNVDFVGYCEDLFKILEPNSKEVIGEARQSVPFIKEMYNELNYSGGQNNIIVVQNRTMNGISLINESNGTEPFYEMIANMSLLFATHYDKIFSITRTSSRDVVGIGFSLLSFDKYIFANYLLQKAMLGAIDNQSVNNTEVDVNKAKEKASEILKDKENILSEFIKNIKANDNPDFKNIERNIEKISEDTLEYFKNDKDITAKAAVLAHALSKNECELFSSSFYSINNKCFEDLYKEAIDYYIYQDDVAYYKIDDERMQNRIEELKDVNRTLVQTEIMIRDLEKKLEEYDSQIEKNDKVKECVVDDGYFSFDNKRFRLLPNIDEEPLSDNYEPHEVRVKSVDLKSKFSRVKDQGQQGSCLSFTLTSIFEYMMKIGKHENCDLSEAFLYYTSRHLDENESVADDSGSRFLPSIKALSQYGIPLEKYWPYNDAVYDTKPSDEAYKDAETRKLIKALNVKCNVKDIKSALADGYPVAGSFTLYPSFNQNGAYIQMPTQDEINDADACEKERHSRHAMTIVGFSDELQMFLVRNSWGERWGDNGYCYIPYSYIEDKNLFNFACIITEIVSLENKKVALDNVPALEIKSSDILIRYYITLASLKIQNEKVKHLKLERKSLIQYIETQKNIYSDSNLRDKFIDANVSNLNEINENLDSEIKQCESDKEEKLKWFKKQKKNIWILCGILLLVALLIFFVFKSIYLPLIPIPIIAYLFIWKFLKYRRDWIDETKRLNNVIKSNKKKIEDNKDRIALFRNKTFAAWTTITSLYNCQSQLEQMYTKLINLINNLRIWYVETQNLSNDNCFESRFPNISVLDKESLDNYFETELRNSGVCDVDLCEDITNHQISTDYLLEYKNNLKKKLSSQLINHLEELSFNLSEHVADGKFSNLIKEIDLDLIDKWQYQSNIFLHVESNERPIIIPNNIVFGYNSNLIGNKLSNKLRNATFEDYDDRYNILLTSVVTLSFDECVVFK